jgi:hypothetical protein
MDRLSLSFYLRPVRRWVRSEVLPAQTARIGPRFAPGRAGLRHRREGLEVFWPAEARVSRGVRSFPMIAIASVVLLVKDLPPQKTLHKSLSQNVTS